MKLMLTNDHGEVHSIDISDEMTVMTKTLSNFPNILYKKLSDMQALIECDMNIPNSNQQIFHHGNLLDNKQSTIKQLGINQDDIILVRNNAPVPTYFSSVIHPSSNISFFKCCRSSRRDETKINRQSATHGPIDSSKIMFKFKNLSY